MRTFLQNIGVVVVAGCAGLVACGTSNSSGSGQGGSSGSTGYGGTAGNTGGTGGGAGTSGQGMGGSGGQSDAGMSLAQFCNLICPPAVACAPSNDGGPQIYPTSMEQCMAWCPINFATCTSADFAAAVGCGNTNCDGAAFTNCIGNRPCLTNGDGGLGQ